jgi:hypothetical protein
MANDSVSLEKELSDFIASFEKSAESKKDDSKTEHNSGNYPPFFVELIDGIRNSLKLVKDYTKIPQMNGADNGCSEYFSRISDEIENIEGVIGCFLRYNELSTPIKKRNTIINLIEAVLKKNESRLRERGILVFRRFEDDLPETIIPDEQLKYILDSSLQYAIASTAPGGGVAFSTRIVSADMEGGKGHPFSQEQTKCVEIQVIFTNHKRTVEEFEETFKVYGHQEIEQASDLMSRLIKETVHRNYGTMDLNIDREKGKTSIVLRFPVERREVVCYPLGK